MHSYAALVRPTRTIRAYYYKIPIQFTVLKLKTQNMKAMKRMGTLFILKHQCTGADQGFLRGAPTPMGAPNYYFAKFS